MFHAFAIKFGLRDYRVNERTNYQIHHHCYIIEEQGNKGE